MPSIDNKVVTITFDNAAFEKNVAQSLDTIDKLKKSLDFPNAAAGLDQISNAANRFSLSGIAASVDNISSKFSAMGVVGATALVSLTQAAFSAAKSMASALTDPVLSSGKERAIAIEQAKFQFRGLGIDVEQAMASALDAVRGTAYGLGDAAKAAAQLGASGIPAGDKMTSILRAIAGSAAMTGSSFSEMSDIFVSSAAIGKVTNMDLQQFGTRGLNAAAAVAKQLGLTEAQVHQMAADGKLDFKTFSDAMDKAFGAHATQANETYTGSLANMKAALARLGAEIQGPHLTQMRDLFNAVTPAIDQVTGSLKPLIYSFNLMFGSISTKIIDKIQKGLDLSKFSLAISWFAHNLYTAFESIGKILGAVGKAFRDVFPASFGDYALSISLAFGKLVEALKPSPAVIEKLTSVFRGIFSVLSIGWTVIKTVAGAFIGLFGTLAKANGGKILDFFARLGDKLFELKKSLVDGGGIQRAFSSFLQPIFDFLGNINLGKAIGVIADKLRQLKDAILNIFSKPSTAGADALSGAADKLSQRWGWLISVGQKLAQFWDWLMGKLKSVAGLVANFFGSIADAFSKGDFSPILDVLNTGLFAAIGLAFAKFVRDGIKLDVGNGFFAKLSTSLDQLNGTLQAMQTNLRAEAIEKIAIAIGILTISVVALSMIDSAKLTKAMIGLAVGFGELVGVLKLLDEVAGSNLDATKIAIMSASLILVAGALVILSIAVKIFSTMDMGELAKGLVGVGVGLGEMVLAIKLLPPPDEMSKAGLSMIAMGIAMVIMAAAVKIMGSMDLATLGKGLGGIAVGLGLMVGAIQLLPPPEEMSTAGLSMLAMAVAMVILSAAVYLMGSQDLGQLAKGLGAIAVAMLILVIALNAMDEALPGAAATIIAAGALVILAYALKQFSTISIADMAKDLISIGLALVILAFGTLLMSDSIPGAVALVIISAALVILAFALKQFAQINIGDFVKGLIMIAVAIGLLAIASMLIAPIIPEMLGLAVALLAIGAAAALFGIGAVLIGAACLLIAVSVQILVNVGIEGLKTFAEGLPIIAKGVADALIVMAQTIIDALPGLISGLGAALDALLQVLIDEIPKFAEMMNTLIPAVLQVIRNNFPDIVQTGWEMLLAFMQGLDDHITELVDKAAEIIVKFTDGLSAHAGEIITAGANLLVSVLQGITDNIDTVLDAVTKVITKFIEGMAAHANEIITAGADALGSLLAGIEQNLENIVGTVTKLITKFTESLGSHFLELLAAGAALLDTILFGLENVIEHIVGTVTKVIIKFTDSLASHFLELLGAGVDLLDTVLFGIALAIEHVGNTVVTIILRLLKGFADNVKLLMLGGVYMLLSILHGAAEATLILAIGAAIILIKFLNALTDAINTYAPQIRTAGARLALAIIDAVTGGIASWGWKAAVAVGNWATGLLKRAYQALGINSPSKEFIKVAKSIAEGVVVGLDDDRTAGKSVGRFSNNLINAMNNTLSNVASLVDHSKDFNPTITPVVDLSNVEKSANKMSGIIGSPTLSAKVSYDQAASIAVVNRDQQQATSDANAQANQTGVRDVKFEQTIIAPTPLSPGDVYRATKSQFALATQELVK